MLQSLGKIKTNDFEEFCDWNLAQGIDLNHRQLERGNGTTEAAFAVFDELIVWRYRGSRRTLAEFAIPDEWVEVCLADFPEHPVWCGQRIPKSSLTIHLGGRTYEYVLPSGGNSFGIMVPKSRLMNSSSLLDEHLNQATECQLIAAWSKSISHSINRINSLMESPIQTKRGDDQTDEMFAECQQMIDQVVLNRVSCPIVAENELVDLSRQFIRRHLTEHLTVKDLLTQLNVSRRTLELAFRKQFGVTPYQFLLIERLCAARRLLRRSQKTVLEVCIDCGFEDASRFSKMYVRHFGELPSKTLKMPFPNDS